VELALFASDVSTPDRVEIDQILSQNPVNFDQANDNENFMIALALNYLKINFNWKCISPPLAPSKEALCTNWELLLA